MTERQKRMSALKTALDAPVRVFGFGEEVVFERMLAELELVERKEETAEKQLEAVWRGAYEFAVDSDDEQWAALLRIREKRNED